MSPSQARLPAPSARFILGLLLLGSLAGIALVLLDAPLWLFYLAPLLAVPVLLHALHSLDGSDASAAHPDLPFRIWRRKRFIDSPDAYIWLLHWADRLRHRYNASISFAWGILGVGTALVGISLSPGWLPWWVGASVIVFSVVLLLFLTFDIVLRKEVFEYEELRVQARSWASRELEVIPCEGEWAIQSPGEPWTIQFRSRDSAREAAADYLRKHEGGEVVLRNHEGAVETREMIDDLDRAGRESDIDPMAPPELETTMPYGDVGAEGESRSDARERKAKRRKQRDSKRRRRPPS